MAATYSSLVGIAVGGKYEVRRVLGVGGMGVVCEAMHLDLGKKVAIKLIDKSMKESELIVARFRREARAAGQIQSEHIVDVFDVGADARVGLYMVMEHLTGEDLQARLERENRLDVKTTVMLAHQIARGLAKAHQAGVIHRDLKPANVYLTQRDNGQMLVKLLDFGVSKLLGDNPGSARITGSGAPIGTPLYMSPEQAEGKDDVDGRADIWSLGAVLYESLAGGPPFADRGSYHGTIVGILTTRARPLAEVAPWVPAALAAAIDAMLVHDPKARIQNAGAVTERLLEAFPAVLPDGTGRHTAVIIPQHLAAVDAIGDTEFFNSAAFREAQEKSQSVLRKERSSDAPSNKPSSPPRDPHDPRASAPGAETATPESQSDSAKTVPNMSGSSPGAPNEGQAWGGRPAEGALVSGIPFTNDARRTGAATPVEGSLDTPGAGGLRFGSDPDLGASSDPDWTGPRAQRGPATQPLLPPTPSSSARGVALPATPPIIEPLPPSEIAPDTTRDTSLALRAERRRNVMFGLLGALVVSVAVGGYYAGKRASTNRPASETREPTSFASVGSVVKGGEPTPSATQAPSASTNVAVPSGPASALPSDPGVAPTPSSPAGSAKPGEGVTPAVSAQPPPVPATTAIGTPVPSARPAPKPKARRPKPPPPEATGDVAPQEPPKEAPPTTPSPPAPEEAPAP